MDAELVDRCQIACGGQLSVLRGDECTASLGEGFQDEGRGQESVAADARVGRADELQEGTPPFLDLEHLVEQQEGRPVGQTRKAVHGASKRSGRHAPPRARPSTTATRTSAARARPATTPSPLRAGGT